MTDLQHLVWSDLDRLGGIPCFRGTRVPVHSLFDHLAAGDTLADFIESFPTVSQGQAAAVLNLAARWIDDTSWKQPEDQQAVQVASQA
jgi:uncharacterized protein (DUF433 family)